MSLHPLGNHAHFCVIYLRRVKNIILHKFLKTILWNSQYFYYLNKPHDLLSSSVHNYLCNATYHVYTVKLPWITESLDWGLVIFTTRFSGENCPWIWLGIKLKRIADSSKLIHKGTTLRICIQEMHEILTGWIAKPRKELKKKNNWKC